MCDPLFYRGEKFLRFLKKKAKKGLSFVSRNKFLFSLIFLAGVVILGKMLILKSTPLAHAFEEEDVIIRELNSPLLQKKDLFEIVDAERGKNIFFQKRIVLEEKQISKDQISEIESKLLNMVGSTPIAEMIPFIAKRESKVAAFLVGIAKKESSFGLASPSKDGSTCFNYWGYKGTGSRGTVLGYSCFGSAEEAVETVGNRIEVLVSKERNTPAKMVDTWKCGKSCAGDPGAPGWVSTVALYFNKIVNNEG